MHTQKKGTADYCLNAESSNERISSSSKTIMKITLARQLQRIPKQNTNEIQTPANGQNWESLSEHPQWERTSCSKRGTLPCLIIKGYGRSLLYHVLLARKLSKRDAIAKERYKRSTPWRQLTQRSSNRWGAVDIPPLPFRNRRMYRRTLSYVIVVSRRHVRVHWYRYRGSGRSQISLTTSWSVRCSNAIPTQEKRAPLT